jgi:hypothetical protein
VTGGTSGGGVAIGLALDKQEYKLGKGGSIEDVRVVARCFES